MLYELRIYEIVPGRAADINARFANVTTKLFAKYGIQMVGFWEPVIGVSNQLIYMLAWESLAEREQKWAVFATDKEWLQAKASSEANGPLVERVINSFLKPTPYSPMQ